MSQINIETPIGDVNEKLSIAFAMEEGYQIILDGDGEAEIANPAGDVYYIRNFECECPDKQCRGGSYKNHCKHEVWISQLRPCELCGSIMSLVRFHTCFAETGHRFECSGCGCTWDVGLVRAERRMNRQTGKPSPRLTAKGRCRQAVAWAKAYSRDYFIWQFVEQSPHLAPLLVRELAAIDEGELADQIAKRYSPKIRVA